MYRDRIIEYLNSSTNSSSTEIFQGIGVGSLATVKRVLSKLIKEDLIISAGKGRATKYSLSPSYSMLMPIYG